MEHSYPENATGIIDFISYINTEAGGLLIGMLLLMMFVILFVSFQRFRQDTLNNAIGALGITTMFSILLLATGLVTMDLVLMLVVVLSVAVAGRGFQKYKRR